MTNTEQEATRVVYKNAKGAISDVVVTLPPDDIAERINSAIKTQNRFLVLPRVGGGSVGLIADSVTFLRTVNEQD